MSYERIPIHFDVGSILFASLAQAQFPSPYSMPIAPDGALARLHALLHAGCADRLLAQLHALLLADSPTAPWPYYGAWYSVPYYPSYYAAEPLPIVPTTPLTTPIPTADLDFLLDVTGPHRHGNPRTGHRRTADTVDNHLFCHLESSHVRPQKILTI